MTKWDLGSRPKPFAPASPPPAIAAAFVAGECAIAGLIVFLVAVELSPPGSKAAAALPQGAVVLAAWLFTTALLTIGVGISVGISTLLKERRARAAHRVRHDGGA